MESYVQKLAKKREANAITVLPLLGACADEDEGESCGCGDGGDGGCCGG